MLGQAQAFVLEIGTEELPPHDVVEATGQVSFYFNMVLHPSINNTVTLAEHLCYDSVLLIFLSLRNL